MESFAMIRDGMVAEIINIEAGTPSLSDRFHPDFIASCVAAPGEVAPGWLWDGEAFAPPPPPEPVPPVVPASISSTQMLLALAAGKVITPAEALAAATMGAVPAAIDAVFAEMPEGDALAARITWATTSVVRRDHSLIAAMIDAGLVTAEEADGLFILAAGM